MGYMYDELKKILTPGKDSSKWSPNNIRALYIARTCMIYVRHVDGMAICRTLDPAKAAADIDKNGATGGMHNLLSNRKLSCLEEIYVDGVFKNYKGAMDLNAYVKGLVSERGRLRYFGYIDFTTWDPNDVCSKYGNDSIEKILYSYAEDKTRKTKLQYWSVGNPTWYLNHSLRPADYPIDGEKGRVGRWFKHCDIVIGDALKKIEAENNAKAQTAMVVSAVRKDLENLEDMKIVLSLHGYLKGKNLYKEVCEAIKGAFYKAYNYADFGIKELQSITGELSKVEQENFESLLSVYRNLGVLVKSSGVKESSFKDAVKAGDGFLGYEAGMNRLLVSLYKSNLKLTLAVASLELKDRIPNGNYRSTLHLADNAGGNVRVYVDILLGTCGFTRESFSKVQKG